MKKLLLLGLIISFVSCQSDIYLEDGIIKCKEDVKVGYIGEVDGISYTVVDSLMLKEILKNNPSNLSFICTSKITNMRGMFYDSDFNGDISKWDVSNVIDMNGMFANSKFNGDISKWDVSNVTNMIKMFYGSDFNGDISKWDVSSVTSMYNMFYGTKKQSVNLNIYFEVLNPNKGMYYD